MTVFFCLGILQTCCKTAAVGSLLLCIGSQLSIILCICFQASLAEGGEVILQVWYVSVLMKNCFNWGGLCNQSCQTVLTVQNGLEPGLSTILPKVVYSLLSFIKTDFIFFFHKGKYFCLLRLCDSKQKLLPLRKIELFLLITKFP